MHLSQFALRDFTDVEKHQAPTGVAVFDDVLPRNGLEAARVRLTGEAPVPWAYLFVPCDTEPCSCRWKIR